MAAPPGWGNPLGDGGPPHHHRHNAKLAGPESAREVAASSNEPAPALPAWQTAVRRKASQWEAAQKAKMLGKQVRLQQRMAAYRGAAAVRIQAAVRGWRARASTPGRGDSSVEAPATTEQAGRAGPRSPAGRDLPEAPASKEQAGLQEIHAAASALVAAVGKMHPTDSGDLEDGPSLAGSQATLEDDANAEDDLALRLKLEERVACMQECIQDWTEKGILGLAEEMAVALEAVRAQRRALDEKRGEKKQQESNSEVSKAAASATGSDCLDSCSGSGSDNDGSYSDW